MKVLLDTNIIIHREANRVARQEIGTLFYWLDRQGYEKCIHQISIDEIRRYKDPKVVSTMEAKIKNYYTLKTISPDNEAIKAIRLKYDKNENDNNDTDILKEVFNDRVDLLITEDRKIHNKAKDLKIPFKVLTIDAFLERSYLENPELSEYKILSINKELFGNIDINDVFFDSFREDYEGFDKWFNKKSEEFAYVCESDTGDILAFLYIKQENMDENYRNIEPVFERRRRLKIGTFKVAANGYKLGERFLKIIFDNAIRFSSEEIYVTIFNKTENQRRLIYLLQDWGFKPHGTKVSDSGIEQVYTRDFSKRVDVNNLYSTYPYISRKQRKFIVPIYPSYHTELFPDSILRTESPEDYRENKPNRNAINKVYISRSYRRDLDPGDIIVFYRTKSGDNKPAKYTSVATTIGVVQRVVTGIPNIDAFTKLCRKRSVFTDKELIEQWNYNKRSRPFIVDFLYVYSLPKRLNLAELQELGIIENAPRGFEEITSEAFECLLEKSNANQRFIID